MTCLKVFGALADALSELQRARNRPLVVGVTGADASGKSRFAAALTRQLMERGACQLVHVDDFHRPRALRYAGTTAESDKYLRQSIDLDRLVAEVLAPIRNRGELHRVLRHLDIVSDTYSVERSYAVDPTTVVVVEGVFLLRQPVRSYLDRLLFLDADDEVLVGRGVDRDQTVHGAAVEAKFRGKFLPAQRSIFAEVPPYEYADVVIDNNDWSRPVVKKWALP